MIILIDILYIITIVSAISTIVVAKALASQDSNAYTGRSSRKTHKTAKFQVTGFRQFNLTQL